MKGKGIKMKLNYASYKDKVNACWIGKNIGGTMGTPYEGQRKTHDIHGFATAANVVLPNDDLDLQLVWLLALEQQGPKAVNASLLGEYWLSFISPHWNEYGIGKANMKAGLPPPLSGDYENSWKHSNGAWIRTEIWASIAPAMPDVAAKYAMEDAMVDHGAGEGTFAAAFVAAMQSAAFAVKDIRKCIEIGLAAIPEESRMAKSVRLAIECYEKKMTWLEARNAVFESNADLGDGWFEAPSNVTYAVIGLLWGEGDFKKTMITAINCGDDTDCTGATVGATLGILYGNAGIPEDWKQHIGDSIVTISICRGNNARDLPDTCTELTERVVKLAPSVLYAYNISKEYRNDMTFGDDDEIPENIEEIFKNNLKHSVYLDACSLKPYTMDFTSTYVKARVTLDKAPDIKPNDEITAHISFQNRLSFENHPHPLSLRWILPEGFSVEGKRSVIVPEFSPHGHGDIALDYVIRSGESVSATNRIVLELEPVGRHQPMYISFVLLG